MDDAYGSPSPRETFNTPRRWAARVAFPVAAVGVVLGFRAINADAPDVWWVSAAACGVGAVALFRIGRRNIGR